MQGQVIGFPLEFHPEPGAELVLGEWSLYKAKTERLHLGFEIQSSK